MAEYDDDFEVEDSYEMLDFDDQQLLHLIEAGEAAIARGDTITHEEVKKRLGYVREGDGKNRFKV